MPAAEKLSLVERFALRDDVRALVEELLQADGLMPLEVCDWLDLARRAAPPSPIVARWLDDAIRAWAVRSCEGSPGASATDRLKRYRCVGACEALVADGMRPLEAAQTLAPIARKVGLRTSRGGRVTATTIYGWWKRLRAAPGARLMRRELTEAAAKPAIAATALEIFSRVGR